MAEIKPRVGCIIFSKSGNDVYTCLVYSNYSKQWEFPRGGVDEGNLLRALVREVKEETGIELPANSKFYKVEEFEEYRMLKTGVRLHWKVLLYTTYLQNMTKLNPIDTKEIKEARWVKFDEAIKLLYLTKNYELIKALVKAYLIMIRKGYL